VYTISNVNIHRFSIHLLLIATDSKLVHDVGVFKVVVSTAQLLSQGLFSVNKLQNTPGLKTS
jgi:hypothetical protein